MNRYEALRHAVKAHAGQTDKCGQPYILHPIAVAEATERGGNPGVRKEVGITLWDGGKKDVIVVALLHDVYEDTDYPWLYDELSPTQRAAIMAITRAKNEPYDVYLGRVMNSGLASVVKLADIWHNLQPERQAYLPEKERSSLEKRYLKARDRIWEALGYEWWPR